MEIQTFKSFNLIRICASCGADITEENSYYPQLCSECAEKQAHLELIRERVKKLEEKITPFLWRGRRTVRCPYCGSRAELLGNSVLMIKCDFCGLFARRVSYNFPFKLYFMIDNKWELFHYERDVTFGSVWEIFEKIDNERIKTQSKILDYQKRLKDLGL